jgi:cytochrome c553
MQNSDGQVTYELLRGAVYAKDNRILPLGFNKETASQDIAVYGEAATDNSFTGGSDRVTYRINTEGISGSLNISAELLYHPVSYQFTRDLMNGGSDTIEDFTDLYESIDKTPVQITSVSQNTGITTTTPQPTATDPALAPVILHDVAGRIGLCLICHGEQGTEDIRFPDTHIGRTADMCLICHEAATGGLTSTPSPKPTTTTTAVITWGDLATHGARSFAANCAPCHGDEGQGGGEAPQNIGPSLRSFVTAQRFFNFISEAAPMDLPGGLSKLKYQQIMAFMLIESDLVQPEAIFDEGNLTNVSLKE